jgi:hypothetical protein
MDVPAIVVKPGDGRSVSLGGMGVVFKVRRVYGACSRKAADRSHLGHTELDRWASDHLMICTRSATLLLLPSKRVLLEIRTSLRHCRSPFPGNGILRGRDRRRRKGPSQSTDRQQRQSPAGKPTNSALFARHRENSVCVGLRGGAGRTRTCNQTIISSWLAKCLKCRGLRWALCLPTELQRNGFSGLVPADKPASSLPPRELRCAWWLAKMRLVAGFIARPLPKQCSASTG